MPLSELSNREIQIADLIVSGLTSPAIADQLFISLSTVKTHRKNIYKKLGIHSMIELVKKIPAKEEV